MKTAKVKLTVSVLIEAGDAKIPMKARGSVDALGACQDSTLAGAVQGELDELSEKTIEEAIFVAGNLLERIEKSAGNQRDPAQARLPGEPAEEKPKARSRSLPRPNEPTNP